MIPFRVVGIPEEMARQARAEMRSPQYGHPAHTEVAKGYGPCRSCLQKFQTGRDERLLFTFNPFAGLDPYPSPGPVFIHREECPTYDAPAFPPQLRDLPLTFEGYGRDRWIVARERVADGEVEPAIERLLAREDVEYVHVRNTEAGCFIALVGRAC
ncbi:MAG TPA: DUF1203 domain-containing protein [Thermoanaerobaculia bacterium]|nr:DUF1203 domain-containing protein [Thermoanaerobaculia bacterium]